MELVEASPEDIDALVKRWYSLAEAMEAYDELNELAYEGLDDVSGDGFRAHLTDDDVTDYLVVHDDVTIGFVTLRESHHPSRRHARSLRIVNLMLDEGYRNQGHGTAVVERVADIASESGCDSVVASCEWHNEDARRFYRDVGFRPKQVDFARQIE